MNKLLRFLLRPYFYIVEPRCVVRDAVGGYVCEEEYFDRLTGRSVGYWAYGVWIKDSLYTRGESC